jgi:hypothetical protein
VQGWLSMTDISGVGSRIELLVLDEATGARIYDCSQSAPGQRDDLPPGDFDIVQIGKFAQQGTAAVLPGPPERDDFIDFMHAFCMGPNPNTLTVTCPFQGQQIDTAPNHVTVKHTGTFRSGPNQQLTTFEVTGHKDAAVCEVVIDGVAYEAGGTLVRLTDKQVGNPSPGSPWQTELDFVDIGTLSDLLGR